MNQNTEVSNRLPEWLRKDNEARTGAYARDLDDERFLRDLNDILEPHEEAQPIEALEPYPIIFFFGLPRCGKTVFSQMLVHALDLGYPNNIVARFWKAPTYGIHLSNILLKASDGQVEFTSDYGKTSNLSEPHDFAYFWHHWLKIQDFPYDYLTLREKIDWEGLRRALSRMAATWDKPSVFKGVNPSYHLSKLADVYPKSLFIYVQRDYIDAAVSLRKARLDNYNDLSHWYGQTPDPQTYEDLKDRPYYEQIGGQFKYLTQMFEDELARIPAEKTLKVSYRSFCHDPNGMIDAIQDRLETLFRQSVTRKNDIDPDSLALSQHSSSLPFYSELCEGLKTFRLSPTME